MRMCTMEHDEGDAVTSNARCNRSPKGCAASSNVQCNCYPEGCAATSNVQCQCNARGSLSKLAGVPPRRKINVTSKSPVGDISVVTLIRTDTTLDHSQKAEKVWLKDSLDSTCTLRLETRVRVPSGALPLFFGRLRQFLHAVPRLEDVVRSANPALKEASQRSLHNAPIFRLLLKVAVKGTHQCDFLNFCGAAWPQRMWIMNSVAPCMHWGFSMSARSKCQQPFPEHASYMHSLPDSD